MRQPLAILAHNQHADWQMPAIVADQQHALISLENGRIVLFPQLQFKLTAKEQQWLLSPDIVSGRSKNVSFDVKQNSVQGSHLTGEKLQLLRDMMARYASCCHTLLQNLLPGYQEYIQSGRTSYRPVQVAGRQLSIRKNDALLHVDAFPATPNQGTRILRVFANVHPAAEARIWRVSNETFEQIAKRFLPKLSAPWPGKHQLLQSLRLTKTKRSMYDHYMLSLHNHMKYDMYYQAVTNQERLAFPPGAVWAVYTDQVAHAALSGQYLLEQTFYLPPEGLNQTALAPLRILERLMRCSLLH